MDRWNLLDVWADRYIFLPLFLILFNLFFLNQRQTLLSFGICINGSFYEINRTSTIEHFLVMPRKQFHHVQCVGQNIAFYFSKAGLQRHMLGALTVYCLRSSFSYSNSQTYSQKFYSYPHIQTLVTSVKFMCLVQDDTPVSLSSLFLSLNANSLWLLRNRLPQIFCFILCIKWSLFGMRLISFRSVFVYLFKFILGMLLIKDCQWKNLFSLRTLYSNTSF